MNPLILFIFSIALLPTLFAEKNGKLIFIVVGDWGRNGKENQTLVAESMGKWCQVNGPCDFIVSSGDNMYSSGVPDDHAKQFDTSFEQVYVHPGLEGLRWYLALGNHDYRYLCDIIFLYSFLLEVILMLRFCTRVIRRDGSCQIIFTTRRLRFRISRIKMERLLAFWKHPPVVHYEKMKNEMFHWEWKW